MIRTFTLLFLLFSVLFASEKPHVLVTIAPQKFLIEKIAGDFVSVQVVVPAGASSHTYEPTMKQMLHAKEAKIWFCIGENFETYFLKNLGKDLVIAHAVDAIDPLRGSCCSCACHDYDLHFWLAPTQLMLHAKQIEKELSKLCPEKATLFAENTKVLLEELSALDGEIKTLLEPKKDKVICVSHSSFGYFCRDYGLKELVIEFEGKEPSARHLAHLLDSAKEANVKHLYLQIQHNVRGARKVAQDLGAESIFLDPYEEDVISNLRKIAKAFSA